MATSDIPTMLFDLGSYNIRASLTTDEKPRFIIPSAFPTGEHDFEIDKPIPPECTPSFAISDGEVDNEDRMTYLFASIFDSIFPSDQPEPIDLRVVLTNAPYPSKKHTSYISQMTFEILQADSIIMKPPALYTLTQFSLPTCICVDVGFDVTHIVPIQDNFVCSPAVMRSTAAGSAVDLYVAVDHLQIENVTTWEQMERARKIKEQVAVVALNYEDEIEDPEKEFPCTCGELLFNTPLFELATPEDQEPDERVATLTEEPTVAALIKKSIEQCDLNMRGKLWQNIIVSGGSTKMKGFRERLLQDLTSISPSTITPKLRFPDDPSLAAWYGQKLCINFSNSEPWFNRLEYEEDPEGVYRKFIQYGIADPNKGKTEK
ncbi:Actin family protein [Tritrichomonas foetus]|uniref:Actin family protein n=1 Tax=Tritrichomonas foetus TaxID=1144522 RepID=A0A1J4L6L8_9EUKA|nr:Actin family protein [Tritrichomonas foetus]|eukprot:OHT17589.1 Actin family protein [Tritrichomonas foetus]